MQFGEVVTTSNTRLEGLSKTTMSAFRQQFEPDICLLKPTF